MGAGHNLCVLLADDSISMSVDGKAEAVNEGLREMLYLMKLKSPEADAFDVAIASFGDDILATTSRL